MNQGIGSLDALKAKLDESAGSAKSFAAVMSDNLDGAAKGFGSAWDALLIKLGTPVLDTLKGQLNAIAERLRGFVTDGTAAAFGNAIKAAFESAGKWAAEFFAKVDFAQVAANLQAFAARAGEVFTTLGQHATTAGGVLQTAYGVMSTGLNVVLASIYKVGEGASWLASAFLADLALISDGIAKITFGSLSDGFAQAAALMRAEAQAAYAVSDEFARKSTEAFSAAAEGAETAANGWKTLTAATTEAAPAVTAAGAAVKTVGEQATLTAEQLDALGNGAQFVAGEVTKAGSAATAAAPQLRELGTDAAAAAQQVEAAFSRLGVTSQAALETTAANARRDFDIIKNSGTATARDIQVAFAAYAQKAIAANGGVVDATLQAEAAMRGLKIEADGAGSVIVSKMFEAVSATDRLGEAASRTARKFDDIGRSAKKAASAVQQTMVQETESVSAGAGMRGEYTSPLTDLYAEAEAVGGKELRARADAIYKRMAKQMEGLTATPERIGKIMSEIDVLIANAKAQRKQQDAPTQQTTAAPRGGSVSGNTQYTAPGAGAQAPGPHGVIPDRVYRVDLNVGGRTHPLYGAPGDVDGFLAALESAQRSAS